MFQIQIKNFERELFAQFAKSFALRQKMLNFLQNLEYYMTFEVLEPNWVEMIAKIKSGNIENVDQVRTNLLDFYFFLRKPLKIYFVSFPGS